MSLPNSLPARGACRRSGQGRDRCGVPAGRRRLAACLLPFCLVLGLAVAGCGQPFVDSRREAGSTATVGASTPDAPVICYAKGETPAQQVGAMANAVCAETGRVARFEGEDVMQCRLMQPWRARFTCVAPGTAGAGTLPPSAPSGRATIRRGAVGGAMGNGAMEADGAIYPGGALPDLPRF